MKLEKNSQKGFTLIELLVTVAVLGIIVGLSIPIVRNIQLAQIEKRYTTYMDSVSHSAKLYTDSYSEDLFGDSTTGCQYVDYQTLSNYKLLKDIDMSGISCNSDLTAVKIVKYNDKYYYKPFIGCGAEKNGKAINADIFRPDKLDKSSVCISGSNKLINIEGVPPTDEGLINKEYAPKIRLVSETGVSKEKTPRVYYGYSYDESPNIIGGEWHPVEFKIANKALQEKWIRESKTQIFSSTSTLPTPGGLTGDLYLVIRVDLLEDLNGYPWQTGSDNYIYLGPYRVDNEPPSLNDSRIISSAGNSYQSKKPKLDFKATDEHFSAASDLKICYSYDTEPRCPVPSSYSDLSKMKEYQEYKPNKVLKEISKNYNGSTHDIYITIADAAGNTVSQKYNYRVANSFKLTFDSTEGSKCANDHIFQIENKQWTAKVVDEAGYNNNAFCKTERVGYSLDGWYTEPNGKGKQVKESDLATSNLVVFAKWKAKAVKVRFDCNGGKTSSDQTFTAGIANQHFSRTCTKTGNNLVGWKFDKQGSKKDYDVGNAVSVAWINAHSPKTTLYAHWEIASYKCQAGYYLKKGAEGCSVCPKNNYCPGGTYKYNTSKDQGINACITQYPNTNGTGKSKSSDCYMNVPQNKYIKTANDKTPTTCPTGQYKEAHIVQYGKISSCLPKKITVTFNCNGGSASNSNETFSTDGTNLRFSKNCGTYTGQSHTGWKRSKTGTKSDYSVNSAVTENWIINNMPSITLYAHWEPNPITVKYDPNGGTGTMPDKTCYYGQNCTTDRNQFTRTGHSYDKWAYDKECRNEVPATFKATGSVTLYACWTPNKYKISYSPNGGTGTMNPTECTYGKTCNLSANTFKYLGYNHGGWWTLPSGGSKYGNTTTIYGHTTVYAHWNPKTITVTFNCNGGTGGGTQSFTAGTPNQKFNKNCSKTGNSQLGWSFNNKATTATYTVNNSVTDAWIDGNDQKTLYAIWGANTYTCSAGTYLKKSTTSCSDCPKGYYCSGGKFTFSTTSDQGIAACPSGYGNTVNTKSSNASQCYMKVPADKYVKTAKTAAIACATGYTSTAHDVYYGNTSSCYLRSFPCSAGTYLKKSTVSCSDCPKNYYCGGGTYKYSTSTDQGISACPTGYSNTASTKSTNASQCYMGVPAGKYVKTAKVTSAVACDSGYTTLAHNVLYGSTSSCSTRSISCAAGKYLKKSTTDCSNCPKNYYCPGGTFTFSKTADQGINACPAAYGNTSGTNSTNISQCYMSVPANKYIKTAKDTTATACQPGYSRTAHTVGYGSTSSCAANTFTVSYNANGGSGSMANTTCTYGSNCNLRSNSLSKSNYTFAGWATSATGNVVYANGANVKNAATSGTLILYARWRSNNITLRIKMHDGEKIMASTPKGGTWSKNSEGYVVENGSVYSASFARGTAVAFNPANHRNDGFIFITKANSGADYEKAWICESGCKGTVYFSDGPMTINTNNIIADDNYEGNIVVRVNWRPAKVIIMYNINGGKVLNLPQGYYVDESGWIYNNVKGGPYDDIGSPYIHTLDQRQNLSSDGLVNYNFPTFINIQKPSGKSAPRGAIAWKRKYNNSIYSCNSDTYSQASNTGYNGASFCNISSSEGDCICMLKINWQ